jgi:hypothetical protein
MLRYNIVDNFHTLQCLEPECSFAIYLILFQTSDVLVNELQSKYPLLLGPDRVQEAQVCFCLFLFRSLS